MLLKMTNTTFYVSNEHKIILRKKKDLKLSTGYFLIYDSLGLVSLFNSISIVMCYLMPGPEEER